jgi:DNA-binding LacI/PurR family transcriptional regulator
MPAKATSIDIAYLAGVSQSTVSRALRGSPTVSEETRKRIEEIAHKLNYTVDKNASNLRSQHSNTIALLFFEDPTSDDSLINPFFLSMLGSIIRICAQRGYDLLISFQEPASNWHVTYEDSKKADGIILLGYGDYLEYRARLEQLVAHGTHFVRWGAVMEGQPGISIGCDNFRGGYDAAKHLLDHGRRRLAFLGDASNHYPEFLERYRGYAAAIEETGGQPLPQLRVDAITTEQSGYHAARELLGRNEPFDAIFAASDLIALGAMHALRDAGISIPAEVAVVGFDDIPAASLANPPLTTVMQDTRRAAEVLVDTLVKSICDEPAISMVFPARLVVRQSCGALNESVNPGGLGNAQNQNARYQKAHASNGEGIDRGAAKQPLEQ